MKKHNWITISEFCGTYGNSKESVFAMKCTGAIPKSAFKKISSKVTMIDENYFIRRVEFKKRITNEMHDYYFYLTRYFSEAEICRMIYKIDSTQSLSTWQAFLSNGLFALNNDSIMTTKVPPKKWAFYRYSTWIIRKEMLKHGMKLGEFDIDIAYGLKEKKKKVEINSPISLYFTQAYKDSLLYVMKKTEMMIKRESKKNKLLMENAA